MEPDLKGEITHMTPELVELRRDFHRHPELAFHETRTAQLVAERLRSLGLEVTTGVGRTGVVGLLSGGTNGRTVAIRADMDALPVAEEIESAYKSQNPGVMHACGHDGHTAAALSVATLLARRRAELRGSVKFLFQPAEETASGAESMIRDGAMRDPKVDAVLSAHLWNYIPVGKVGVRAGPVFSSVDDIRILIKGRGGHAGLPHQTVDPVPVAAQVILGLQHLVSREVSPFQPAVVTIGMVQGGAAFNVIPDTVSMAGTLRTFDLALRDRLVQRVEEVVRGICLAMGADYEFQARVCCPPVVNDERMAELVRRAAQAVLGIENVLTAEQSTTGDDAAYFNQEAPGCYFLVGSGNPEKGLDRPHHHAHFDFDEAALPIAVEVLARSALDYLAGG